MRMRNALLRSAALRPSTGAGKPGALSVSQIRALKRNRREFVPTDEPDDEARGGYYRIRALPPGPHAPAKHEAQVLRRLCAQTGLSPDEVRTHATYRRQLSAAAQAQSKPSTIRKDPGLRFILQLLKSVQRETALPHWHPGLRAAFAAAWESRTPFWAQARRPANLSAQQAFALAAQHKWGAGR